MRILIVEDGWGAYILPAVRSLGAAGHTIGLAGPRRSRAAASRWVTRTHLVPPAEADLAAFADAVRAALTAGNYDLVFGGDDVEVLALSAIRDTLDAVFPYAPHDSVLRSIDKLQLASAATRAGLGTPRTLPAEQPLPADLLLPVFVKARLHWTPGATTGSGRVPVQLCHTSQELDSAISAVTQAGGDAVVQELIDGGLMAVTTLCGPGGDVLAESQQVATRVSPRLRTSTRARTTPVDEELSAGIARLLADLGWTGIANLQFLRPPDGSPPQLIDFNGRFYGSLVLARAAGLDLPAAWARLGVSPSAITAADPRRGRPGVRYQSLEEDLRRARVERRGGLARDLLGTLAYATTAVHTTWDRTDPRPTAARLGELLSRQTAGRAGRAAADDGDGDGPVSVSAVRTRRERRAG